MGSAFLLGTRTALTTNFSTTAWYPIGSCKPLGPAAETNIQRIFRRAGTLSQLSWRLASNFIPASSTFNVRLGAADAALTVSAPSNTSGTFTDLTHTVSVAAGNALNYKLVTGTGSTGASITWESAAIVWADGTSTSTPCVEAALTNVNWASATEYLPIMGGTDPPTTTETDHKFAVNFPGTPGAAGTLSNLLVNVISNARGSDTTFGTRVNGVNGALVVSVTIGTSGTFEDTTHSDSVSTTNNINYYITTGTGTTSLSVGLLSTDFVSASGYWIPLSASAGTSFSRTITSAHYYPAGFVDTSSSEWTPGFASSYSGFQTRVTTNTFDAGTSAFAIDIGGVDAATSISIGFGTTGLFTDTTNTASGGNSDTLSYHYTYTGGATAGFFSSGLLGVTGKNILVPNTPTGLILNLNAISPGVNVSWSAPVSGDSPTGYKVDRALDSGFTTGLVTRDIALLTSGVDSPVNGIFGLGNGPQYNTTYWYRVRAYDIAGDGANTSGSSITTLGSPYSVGLNAGAFIHNASAISIGSVM